MEDFNAKVTKIRQELNGDAVVLSRTENFAWLTGGRNYIPLCTETGVASIYIDSEKVVLVTNNIEGQRLVAEELVDLPIQLHQINWWEAPTLSESVSTLSKGVKQVIFDTEDVFETRFGSFRMTLTPRDIEKYRALGKDCGFIIGNVIRQAKPGQTEFQVAAQLSRACLDFGIDAIVQLIAADDRIDTVRHPLPTDKVIQNRLMVVLCGRRDGLVLSVTRLVCFSPAAFTLDLEKRHEAATYVDAVAMHELCVGKTGAQVFGKIQQAYADKGFDGEWKFHHQGGSAGYRSREWIATPTSTQKITAPQAFAWNPSVAGTKSEDTVLFHEDGSVEILSLSPDWPLITHKLQDKVYPRSAILTL